MGIKSTLNITRSDAINLIIQQLSIAPDANIASALESILESDKEGMGWYNFVIVEKYVEQDKYGLPRQFGMPDPQ